MLAMQTERGWWAVGRLAEWERRARIEGLADLGKLAGWKRLALLSPHGEVSDIERILLGMLYMTGARILGLVRLGLRVGLGDAVGAAVMMVGFMSCEGLPGIIGLVTARVLLASAYGQG